MTVDDDQTDESRLASYAEALADGVEGALPQWVSSSVASRLAPEEFAARQTEIEQAGQAAAADVGPKVRELLRLDIDEQWTNPLTLVRSAILYPTQVLASAGATEAARDEHAKRFLPDDVFDLAPTSFADLGPQLHDLGVTWGAAKAHVHLQRRRREELR